MGFLGIYLAYGCFGTLTRKPVSESVQTYESVVDLEEQQQASS
jgi:hypothetical protein